MSAPDSPNGASAEFHREWFNVLRDIVPDRHIPSFAFVLETRGIRAEEFGVLLETAREWEVAPAFRAGEETEAAKLLAGVRSRMNNLMKMRDSAHPDTNGLRETRITDLYFG